MTTVFAPALQKARCLCAEPWPTLLRSHLAKLGLDACCRHTLHLRVGGRSSRPKAEFGMTNMWDVVCNNLARRGALGTTTGLARLLVSSPRRRETTLCISTSLLRMAVALALRKETPRLALPMSPADISAALSAKESAEKLPANSGRSMSGAV